MKKTLTILLIILISKLLFTSCEKDRGVNLFTVNQDIEFGRVMDSTIKADPDEFPILSREQFYAAYKYLDEMMEEILQSDEIKYKSEFEWEITIIDKDVMNAFAVPGGRMYFYTGLMKYLKNAASLAGVLGHEMAHVDLRHSTKTMTDLYGVSFLVSLLVDDESSDLAKIAGDMATGASALKFSRNHEYDADRRSMYYLATTKYNPKGIGEFFEQLRADGQTGSTFEFLSTHPDDENRLTHIDEVWDTDETFLELKGSEYGYYGDEYANFLATLPEN